MKKSELEKAHTKMRREIWTADQWMGRTIQLPQDAIFQLLAEKQADAQTERLFVQATWKRIKSDMLFDLIKRQDYVLPYLTVAEQVTRVGDLRKNICAHLKVVRAIVDGGDNTLTNDILDESMTFTARVELFI